MTGLLANTPEETLPTFLGAGRSAGTVNGLLASFEGPLSPGAVNSDVVMAVFTLPANFFNTQNGPNVSVKALGNLLNATSKTVKIIFNPSTAVVGSTVGSGGTTVASTGAITTNGGFELNAKIVKTGLPNSNTQYVQQNVSQIPAAIIAMPAGVATAAVENAPIIIAITGDDTTLATDIVLEYVELTGLA